MSKATVTLPIEEYEDLKNKIFPVSINTWGNGTEYYRFSISYGKTTKDLEEILNQYKNFDQTVQAQALIDQEAKYKSLERVNENLKRLGEIDSESFSKLSKEYKKVPSWIRWFFGSNFNDL